MTDGNLGDASCRCRMGSEIASASMFLRLQVKSSQGMENCVFEQLDGRKRAAVPPPAGPYSRAVRIAASVRRAFGESLASRCRLSDRALGVRSQCVEEGLSGCRVLVVRALVGGQRQGVILRSRGESCNTPG